MSSSRLTASLRIAVLLGAAALALSCASGPPLVPHLNAKPLPQSGYLSPTEATLIYGQVHKPGFLGQQDETLRYEFTQIDPSKEALLVSPGRAGPVFFLQPVKVGSVMHLTTYQWQSGRTVFYGSARFQKGYDLTATAARPGLLYAGSFDLTSKSTKVSFSTPADFGFHPSEKGTEAEALAAILPQLKGTPWAALIEARMKELGK